MDHLDFIHLGCAHLHCVPLDYAHTGRAAAEEEAYRGGPDPTGSKRKKRPECTILIFIVFILISPSDVMLLSAARIPAVC